MGEGSARTRGGGTQVLRAAHRHQVVSLLRSAGPLARTDVATHLGLTPSAVTAIVADLLADRTVRELDPSPTTREASARGRPRILIALDPDAARVLGVQIGARRARVVIADAAGEVISQTSLDVKGVGHRAVVNRVARAAEGLIADHPGGPVASVGICIPGSVDTTTGTVVRSDVLGWEDVPIAGMLGDRLGLAAFAQDVTQAATVAEARFGAAIGVTDALVLDYGARVGIGLIVGGELHRGASGLAGSIGHLPMAGSTVPCRCGRRGCVEVSSSMRAMVGPIGLDPDDDTLVEVTAAVHAYPDTDARTRTAVDHAVDRIAHVVTLFVGLLDPQVLVLTGLVEDYPGVAGALERRIDELVPAERAGRLDIRRSPLGADAWVRGSILVGLQELDPPAPIL